MAKKGAQSPSTRPSQPHDRLFKKLLENKERTEVILREHLPENVAKLLAPDPPKLLSGEYIDESLHSSQSDCLFEVTLQDGNPLLIYVLVEHKSFVDPKTPLQLAGYMVNIWKRYAADHPERKTTLPPIIPLVFYHGKQDWTVPLSVCDMIEDVPALGPYNRSFQYSVRDIGKLAPEQLSSQTDIRAVFQMLRISHLQQVDRDVLGNILALIPDKSDLETPTLLYIVNAVDTQPEELAAALQQAKLKQKEGLMGTIAEAWIKQGKAEGMAEGITKGKVETLLRQVRLKFGNHSSQYEKTVQTASAKQIDQWLDAMVLAQTLDDVFTKTSKPY